MKEDSKEKGDDQERERERKEKKKASICWKDEKGEMDKDGRVSLERESDDERVEGARVSR